MHQAGAGTTLWVVEGCTADSGSCCAAGAGVRCDACGCTSAASAAAPSSSSREAASTPPKPHGCWRSGARLECLHRARGRDHAGRRCAAAHAWSASSAGRVCHQSRRREDGVQHDLHVKLGQHRASNGTKKTELKPGTRSSRKRTQRLQGAARLEHVVRLVAAQLAERVSFMLRARHLRSQKAGRADIEALPSQSPCASKSRLGRAALLTIPSPGFSYRQAKTLSESCCGQQMQAATSPAPRPSGAEG